MITEDYVSFETAKLLKEKGFDEGCRTHYGGDGSFSYEKYEVEASGCEMHNAILAPTLQMAMKWLREIHNIFIQISAILQDQPFVLHYRPSIQDYNAYARCDNFSEYVTYEEACEAAIKYCLENLI